MQLGTASETQQSAYDGYLANFENERSNLKRLRAQFEELRARKRIQEDGLRECKAKWYTINAACDAAYGILELAGAIRNYDGDIAAAARREQSARESADFARGSLERSKAELESTRAQVNDIATEISRTEHEIGALKTALANLRDEIQPHQIVIDAFANALDEAKDVNLADQRPRTLRKLASIAADLDAAMASSTAAVQHANSVLPAGWMEVCIAR